MIRLLSASLYRLKKSAAFWSCLIGMLVIASVFMVMQATSMEYTVPLSRVIFLPLSFLWCGCCRHGQRVYRKGLCRWVYPE